MSVSVQTLLIALWGVITNRRSLFPKVVSYKRSKASVSQTGPEMSGSFSNMLCLLLEPGILGPLTQCSGELRTQAWLATRNPISCMPTNGEP